MNSRILNLSLPLVIVTSFLILSSCSNPFSSDHRSGFRGSGARMYGSGGMYRGSGSHFYNSNGSRSRIENPTLSGSMMIKDQKLPLKDNTSTQSSATSLGVSQTDSSQAEKLEKSVSYNTPDGPVSANFSISRDTNKTITAINVTLLSGDHESRRYVQNFNNSAQQSIVGKKITDISLDAVGGASLTTEAFNKLMQTL